MSQHQPDRHDRQLLIPGWEQKRVAQGSAVIIGAGALGNEVIKNLGLLGFGHLLICDRDTVELTNLNRSVLFTDDDIGRPKAEVAAAALRRLAPATNVTVRVGELTQAVGLGELADADVVLGCLDSRNARLRLLGRCTLVGARLVDGGTHPWGGEVRVRVSPEEACYGCTLTAAQRGEIDVPVHCGAADPASILSTTLVAGWMTVAAAQLVLGQPLPWRLLELSAVQGGTAPVKVSRDPGCPYHQALEKVERAVIGRTATVGQLLTSLPAGAEPLTWAPFLSGGSCPHCHEAYEPGYARSAEVIECPHCSAPIRPDMTQRMRAAEPDTPIAALGVAAEEIIRVRNPEGGYRWLRMAS